MKKKNDKREENKRSAERGKRKEVMDRRKGRKMGGKKERWEGKGMRNSVD